MSSVPVGSGCDHTLGLFHESPFRVSSMMGIITLCIKFQDTKLSNFSYSRGKKEAVMQSVHLLREHAISSTRSSVCKCSPGRTAGEQAHHRYSLITENWLIQQRTQSKKRTHCSQSITKHTQKKLQNSTRPINSCHYGRLAKQKQNKRILSLWVCARCWESVTLPRRLKIQASIL